MEANEAPREDGRCAESSFAVEGVEKRQVTAGCDNIKDNGLRNQCKSL